MPSQTVLTAALSTVEYDEVHSTTQAPSAASGPALISMTRTVPMYSPVWRSEATGVPGPSSMRYEKVLPSSSKTVSVSAKTPLMTRVAPTVVGSPSPSHDVPTLGAHERSWNDRMVAQTESADDGINTAWLQDMVCESEVVLPSVHPVLPLCPRQSPLPKNACRRVGEWMLGKR